VTTSTYAPEVAGHHHAPPARPGRLRRLVRGATDQPAWVRPAAFGLLLLTAVLYLWGLGASGYANEFYAAAVQAGTKSWRALLFGALDAGNAITVDKPPAALWIMGLSGRIFGFNSWSMLVPQALEGVAAVGLLYATVKRWSGPVAGLVAGALFAVTPVAVLMFRFNNPDALLTLLLVAGAYCVTRAVERGSTKWLLLAGTAIGFGFLTKMMQAFLVLPAFARVFLIAAPGRWYRRLGQLLAAGLAVVVSAGWFVALVELWPAASRAYIGGSTDNSELELALGYNGLGRLFGEGGGSGGASGGGGGGGGGFGGAAGLTRMFNSNFGTQISWLLPAALIAIVAGLALAYRAPRTDRFRAGVLLWGLWTVVTGLTFSYMSGIVHEYYTVALAPGIAGLIAVVGVALWRRGDLAARAVLALLVAVTAAWSYVLLDRTPSWHPWIRYAVAVVGVLGVALLLIDRRHLKRLAVVGTIAVVLTGFGASTAYAVSTAATTHNGSTPTAGPAGQRGGMRGGPGGTGGDGQLPSGGMPGNGERPTGTMPQGTRQGSPQGTSKGSSQGMTPPNGSSSSSSGSSSSGSDSQPSGGQMMGGATSAALVKLLKATKSSGVTWSAAVVGSQSAASLELSSDTSVMAIGGWSGSDAYPTLAQFEKYVAEGKIRYYVSGGQQGGGPGGQQGTSSAIATWVAAHYTKVTVGGQTVYDLTAPISSN
jgi:4-amino-4-deoxy-L-arabinose transferase-like glycosyltransferase